MRTKILLLLIFLSVNVVAQKINEEQVPKDVLIGLETIYPEAKVKIWELIDGNYFASIKVDGQSGKAELTPNGKWLMSKFPVSEKELPSNITKYFYDNYKGFKITISQYTEEPDDNNYYYLKIQKKGLNQNEDGELFFDLSGNLTKSTAPEIVKEEPKDEKKVNDDIFEEDKPTKNKKKTKVEDEELDEKPVSKSKSDKVAEASTKPKKANKKNDDESDNGNISSSDVPGAVKKMLEKKFPRCENVSWDQIDSNYFATFFFRVSDQKAEFAPDGKLVSVTTFLDPKNMFRPIENYLIKKYNKYKILKGEKVVYDRMYQKQFPEKHLKNYYYVEISLKVRGSKSPQINKLWFDGIGAIDKIIEGDNDEEDYGDTQNERKGRYDKKYNKDVEESE